MCGWVSISVFPHSITTSHGDCTLPLTPFRLSEALNLCYVCPSSFFPCITEFCSTYSKPLIGAQLCKQSDCLEPGYFHPFPELLLCPWTVSPPESPQSFPPPLRCCSPNSLLSPRNTDLPLGKSLQLQSSHLVSSYF